MSANTTYKLTAGGTNVIFKTPVDTTYVFDGTYDASTNKAATVSTVTNAISELPEPMVFKGSLGTGGTITTLPTASSLNKGYVYKVITAGTYASQSAKVGDTFISDGSAWVLILSGDEPSGTVTNVAVANGGGLTVSGSPITSSGTITVGHSNSVTAKTSSSVKKFTYDEYGHITDSSELSAAESDALASGIDSTKVEQIETNKNNILTVADQTTKYNLLNQAAYTELRNVTYNNGVVTQVNADPRSNLVMQLSLYNGSTFVTQLAQATVTTNGIVSIPFTYSQEGNLIRIGHSGANIDARIVYVIPTDFVVDNKYYFVCTVNNCKQVIDDVTTPYSWQNMAIIPKAIYDSGFTSYQPYAKSNSDLTASSAEDRAALVELVDGSAKNIADFTSTTRTTFTTSTYAGVTVTRNGDIFTISGTNNTGNNNFFNIYYAGSPSTKMIPPGNWVALIEDYTGSVVKDIAVQPCVPAAVPKVFGTPVQFSLSGSEAGNWLRINLRPSTTYDGSFRLMICSQEDYAISTKFVPYRPSYQEFYEQVETNKNNILTVANQSTKYNLSPVESGTSSGADFIVANTNTNIPTGDYYFCWTSISNQGSTTINIYKEDDTRIVNSQEANIVGNVTVAVNVPENGVRFNLYTNVANTLTNIRIIPKTVYDNGFTQYQPYAMSNAELTAAIQAIQAQLANQ